MQLAIFCDQSNTGKYKGTYINQKVSDNQFLINIPIYQTSQTEKIYAWATMCYEKGSSNLYKEGEVIVIDFINDELNYPIIVGKLYKAKNTAELTENNTIIKNLNSLNVYKEANFKKSSGFKLETISGEEIVSAVNLTKKQEQEILVLRNLLETCIKRIKVLEDNNPYFLGGLNN